MQTIQPATVTTPHLEILLPVPKSSALRPLLELEIPLWTVARHCRNPIYLKAATRQLKSQDILRLI